MEVRRAGPDDVEALTDLRWKWRVEERGESGMDRAEFSAHFRSWVESHDQSHPAWVGRLDGPVVGMAWLAVLERIPSPGSPRRRSGSLQSVYVRPEARSLGLGARLVAAVIDEAVRRELEYIVVHPTERAISLYRRAGFSERPGALELDLRGR